LLQSENDLADSDTEIATDLVNLYCALGEPLHSMASQLAKQHFSAAQGSSVTFAEERPLPAEPFRNCFETASAAL
jgi:hypothetical protein